MGTPISGVTALSPGEAVTEKHEIVTRIGNGNRRPTREQLVPTGVRSLIDLGLVEFVWQQQLAGKEPIYSSPIGPVMQYAGTGGIANQVAAVLHVGWDWYLYARSVTSGAVLWRRALDGPCYGRPQAADVDGDGYVESFAPTHGGPKGSEAGYIRSFASDGVPRWTFQNAYDREGTGTITGAGTYYLDDSSKSWATNAFMRATAAPYGQNARIRFLTGANAYSGTQDADGFYPTDRIISQNNEGTRLWVTDAWAATPAVGDQYVIIPTYPSDKVFMHAGQLINESGAFYLYATGFDNHVYKINAITGSLVWKFATLENIEPYPLVIAGYVYFVSIDGKLRKLDAATGALQWETNTGQCDAFLNAVTLGGSLRIVVSSRDNRVYLVSASNGAVLTQSTDTADNIFGDIDSSAVPIQLPGTTDYRIFTGGDSGGGWCFNTNLDTQWQRQLSNVAINSSPVFHNVTGEENGMCALIGDMRGTIFCMDLVTGRELGRLYLKGGIEGYPLYGDIDGDGKIEMVVTTTDGYIACYRFVNGAATVLPGNPSNDRWRGAIGANDPVLPPLKVGLVHWWTFNEASGNRNDSVGSAHLVNMGGGTPLQETTAIGTGLGLAYGQYMGVSTGLVDLSDTDFTVGGFFSNASSTTGIFARSTSVNQRQIFITTESGVLKFSVSFDGSTNAGIVGSQAIDPAAAHCFFAWRDKVAGTINLQVDNGAVYSYPVDGATPLYVPAGLFQYIGTLSNDPVYNGGEVADETGVWTRVLTAAERAAIYNNGSWRSFADLASVSP